VHQLKKPLFNLGINVQEHLAYLNRSDTSKTTWGRAICKLATLPKRLRASRKADVTLLHKVLFGRFYTFEKLLSPPRLFDVDDAIWVHQGSGYTSKIARDFDGVIAGNEYLAEHFRNYGAKVWIVPTAVDVHKYQPIPRPTSSDATIIGWMGSGQNLYVLKQIERVLSELMRKHSDLRLLVCSDQKPNLTDVKATQFSFVPWSAENEVEILNKIDIGIMPLDDSEWTRGKCSFKMLLYMAVGKPVVASPVGMNKLVLNQGDIGFGAYSETSWFESIEWLYLHRSEAIAKGTVGRKLVCEHYSTDKISKQLASIVHEYV
jgi:glycosyltransferase involved in cell wall biosynthesis